MSQQPSILQVLHSVQAQLRSMGVKDLWLFGSAARHAELPHDVDLLVEFQDRPTLTGFMDLKFFLEDQLGMPVDLHSLSSCPDRFMKRIQPDLLHVA